MNIRGFTQILIDNMSILIYNIHEERIFEKKIEEIKDEKKKYCIGYYIYDYHIGNLRNLLVCVSDER